MDHRSALETLLAVHPGPAAAADDRWRQARAHVAGCPLCFERLQRVLGCSAAAIDDPHGCRQTRVSLLALSAPEFARLRHADAQAAHHLLWCTRCRRFWERLRMARPADAAPSPSPTPSPTNGGSDRAPRGALLALFAAPLLAFGPGVWRSAAVARWFAAGPAFNLAQPGLASPAATGRALIASLGLWPLLAVALVYAGLSVMGQPAGLAGWGAGVAWAIALSGGLVCGAPISLLAAGAGGIPVTVILGLGYAGLIAGAGGLAAFADHAAGQPALPQILGGSAALVAPSAGFVLAFALALAALSFLMGRTAWQGVGDYRPGARVSGTVLGAALGGAPIGLVVGLTQAAQAWTDALWPLALAVGCAVGAALYLGTRLYGGAAHRARGFGLGFGALAAGGTLAGFGSLVGTPLGLGLGLVTHVVFQGSFFVLAFAIGARIGGRWAGSAAAGLEGIGGYLGFLAVVHFDDVLVQGALVADLMRPLLWPVHLAGFSLLLTFLLYGQWLHGVALWRWRRAADSAGVAARYARLHAVTAWWPPLAAGTTLISGLALIQTGGHSLAEGWLFCLVALFAYEMAEGIAHYTPWVQHLHRLAQGARTQALAAHRLHRAMHHAGDNLALALHLVSFPVIAWLAVARPVFEAPLACSIRELDAVTGWTFLPAVLLLLAVFAWVIPARRYLWERRTRYGMA